MKFHRRSAPKTQADRHRGACPSFAVFCTISQNRGWGLRHSPHPHLMVGVGARGEGLEQRRMSDDTSMINSEIGWRWC